jgi:hypothetical protein
MTFILMIAAAVLVAMAAGELFRVRYKRLARQRRRETFRTLAGSFHDGDVDPDVLTAAQSYFDQITGVRAFPARPEDGLFEVYGLTREDVQDAVAIIASAVDCQLGDAPAAMGRVTDPTVDGLVRTVHRLRAASRERVAIRHGAAAGWA